MTGSLLVCIAFHYATDRLKYLSQVVSSLLSEYKVPIHIIIDTNIPDDGGLELNDKIQVVSHTDLKHPFHLTWCHRKHFKDNIGKYDNFMYLEDDMYLPFVNYQKYLENFNLLWPNAIPSFVRLERNQENETFITDATESQVLNDLNVINIGGKQFTSLKNPYHAFWLMPRKELKETMIKDFDRLSDSRETAASYPMWELKKMPLVEVFKVDGKYKLSANSFSFHLPNNYAESKESPFGKIKPEKLFTWNSTNA